MEPEFYITDENGNDIDGMKEFDRLIKEAIENEKKRKELEENESRADDGIDGNSEGPSTKLAVTSPKPLRTAK